MVRMCRVLAIAGLVMLAAQSARAAQPTIEYLDFSGLAFTLAGVCAFDIYEEPIGNNEKVATFYGAAGEITFQIVTGVNKWRLTNLSTGKVLDVNGSGPARLFVQPGTNVVRAEGGGTSFLWIPNPPPGVPTYALTRGRVISELDPTTFVVTNLVSQRGKIEDLCALLQ